MKPTFDNGVVQFHLGDARQVLRELPAESVHCIVTSPPYWGLRDYGLEPLVWGGDEGHEHAWGAPVVGRSQSGSLNGSTLDGAPPGKERRPEWESTFCYCGAWRGSLGLEPTIDLYVQHIVEIFREVRRVLRMDGTLWLNLGSSYASGDTSPSRSRGQQHGPAYGTRDKQPRGSQDSDSSCRDLCGGCLGVLESSGSADTARPNGQSQRPVSQIARGSERSGSAEEAAVAVPHGVQESTSLESSEQPPGACLHCPSCGACLAVLRSSQPYALVCARTGERLRRGDKGCPVWDLRNESKDVSGMAYLYSTIAALKPKDLVNIPFYVSEALRKDGWWLRSDIVCSKPNPMPESVTDRPTRAHEYLFLLTKSATYFYDQEAIRESQTGDLRSRTAKIFPKSQEPGQGVKANESFHQAVQSHVDLGGRNKRSVWEIPTEPYPEAHFATFPQKLVEPCILAGTSERGVCPDCGAPWERVVERSPMEPELRTRTSGTMTKPATSKTTGWRPTCDCGHDDTIPGIVLDPFAGSGTVAYVAQRLGRRSIGIDLSAEYLALAEKRMRGQTLPMVL